LNPAGGQCTYGRATALKLADRLGDENGRLKKVVADLSLDRKILQDVIRRKI
jgi:putative transposase